MGSCITTVFDNFEGCERSASPVSKMKWRCLLQHSINYGFRLVWLFSPRFGSVDAAFPEDIQRAQGLLSTVTVARSGSADLRSHPPECLERRNSPFQYVLIGLSQCIDGWRSNNIRNNSSTNQSYIEEAAGMVVARRGRLTYTNGTSNCWRKNSNL